MVFDKIALSLSVKLLISTVTWLALTSTAPASEVRISLHFDKPSYHIGEKMKCRIVFQNISKRTIRLLPRDILFPAGELQFKSLSTGRSGELIRLGEAGFDIEELSKQIVLLHPGEFCTRKIKADVLSTFREVYHDNRRGLILDFPGSALLLPGFGKYEVVKTFQERSDDSVSQYLSAGPPLWEGKVISAPVVIEFTR